MFHFPLSFSERLNSIPTIPKSVPTTAGYLLARMNTRFLPCPTHMTLDFKKYNKIDSKKSVHEKMNIYISKEKYIYIYVLLART